MRLDLAVDEYVKDMRAESRIRSPHTERAYREKLDHLCRTVLNRDPKNIGRDDIKAALARWDHPNSRRQAHAVYTSFFDYAMEEGWRKDNPARQLRRPRTVQPQVYRMTREEALSVLAYTREHTDLTDRALAHLGILAGLRSQELRLLQGKHLNRDGWVWVSQDIGKGGKERWIPVLPELEDVVADIRVQIGIDGYIFPSRRSATPPGGARMISLPAPQSAQALYKRTKRLGVKVGIAGDLTPHVLRRGFGDLIARYAGARAAQVALGHASIDTTVGTYLSGMTLDELALSFSGLRLDLPQLPLSESPHTARRDPNAR